MKGNKCFFIYSIVERFLIISPSCFYGIILEREGMILFGKMYKGNRIIKKIRARKRGRKVC